MAIVSWKEIWQNRGGELDVFGATRRYTRAFRIVTDSTYDAAATLLLAEEFLGLLAIYEDANGIFDIGAIVRRTRCHQPEADNPFVWIVEYDYSSEPLDVQQRGVGGGAGGGGDGGGGSGDPNAPPGQGIQDPIARPPIFSLDFQEYQRVVDRDIFGRPIVNSAGAPFSPLPEVDDTRFILTMERYELEPPWDLILSYQDAVNSDWFLGFAPGVAKVKMKCQAVWENNVYCWKVTYIFSFRSLVLINNLPYSGWDLHLLDQGLYDLDPATNAIRYIQDRSGVPVSEPVLLDGKGHRAGGMSDGVTSVTILTPGVNYASANTVVQFTGGGGSGAAATVTVDNLGRITKVNITNPGSGYTSAPTVAFVAPLGAGATGLATIGPTVANPVYLHFQTSPWLPFSAFNLPASIQ